MSRMHPPQAQRGINIFKKLSRREAIHPQSKQAGARLFDDEPTSSSSKLLLSLWIAYSSHKRHVRINQDRGSITQCIRRITWHCFESR